MKDYREIVRELTAHPSEEEWVECKGNWYDAHGIGEYISSLSNSAAMNGKGNAYLIWGIDNVTHDVVGTRFAHRQDVKNEPLEHYLARQLTPYLNFSFHDVTLNRRRVVVLEIPAAKQSPVAFDNVRYIRIGSSKVNLSKHPEREAALFSVLKNGLPTTENTEADIQELSFRKLFFYYEDRGIVLNRRNFKKNLGLLTKDGTYNLLAQLLSDDSKIPIRVSIFMGRTKADPLYSVREFGNTCLLISLEKILEYGDVLNIMQADEKDRIVERREVPLFDQDAFREAVINAFVHNLWVTGNAPMFTVFNDRIEILSRGTLAPAQTLEGFYTGDSVPVDKRLSDIFLQLHISERSGRGVPKITQVYGREAFEFRENSIIVTIPLNRMLPAAGDRSGGKMGDNVGDNTLNPTRQRILAEMRNNPNITHPQLMRITGLGKTAIQNNVSYLRKNGYVERVGSNRNGYWKVCER